jgi:Fe-S cluster biosynthesis and repair protein YggX
MARTVICRKYKKEMEGLAQPPFPGAKGQALFADVSKQAWQEWLAHQTMLINEKHLNLMDMTARTYLGEQMDKFLSGDNYDAAEGYVPPSDTD